MRTGLHLKCYRPRKTAPLSIKNRESHLRAALLLRSRLATIEAWLTTALLAGHLVSQVPQDPGTNLEAA